MSHTIRDKQKLKARPVRFRARSWRSRKCSTSRTKRCSFTTDCCYPWRGKRSDAEVIKGHLTEHIVHQGDELKRKKIWMSF